MTLQRLMSEGESSEDPSLTEHIGIADFIIVALLAAATWLGLTFWAYPGLPPAVWRDVAVAAGVRPAVHLVPGWYTVLSTWAIDWFGLSSGISALRLLGHIALTTITVLVYAVLRELLAFVMRARPQHSWRRSFVMRCGSVVGTVAFVCADSVWTSGQFLSETTLLIGLTLLSVESFFLFLRKGTLKYACFAAFFLGLLCAETPMGCVFLAGFVGIYCVLLKVFPILESPLFRPAVIAVGKWYATFIFLAALGCGMMLNGWMFYQHGGLAANGLGLADIPVAYLQTYWLRFSEAAGLVGWILWAIVCLVPFAVTLVRFPAASDEDMMLSYSTGLLFLICGCVAFTQSGPLSSLWFWSHTTVNSSYLLSCGMLFSALTLAGSITVFGVDALCRNHARLANQAFGQEDDDLVPAEARLSETVSHIAIFVRRCGLLFVCALAIAAFAITRTKTTEREMLSLLGEAVGEMVREAKGANYLITDGVLDEALEIEAARQGQKLYCLSVASGTSPRDRYLRTRGMLADPEDRFAFGHDCGTGLRHWLTSKPARLAQCAAQTGFGLWRREARPMPAMGGFMARLGADEAATRVQGIASAKALARRILGLCAKTAEADGCTEQDLARAFSAVQWRLARMCGYRAAEAECKGDAKLAAEESALAEKLNAVNSTYAEVMTAARHLNDILLRTLTPREGLQLALLRADFAMGRFYAEMILATMPDDPDANFALAMYSRQVRDFARAEECFMRCLMKKPEEPAVYNNLALVQLSLGKLEAAEINANKALKLRPGSTEILDTLATLRRARAEKK